MVNNAPNLGGYATTQGGQQSNQHEQNTYPNPNSNNRPTISPNIYLYNSVYQSDPHPGSTIQANFQFNSATGRQIVSGCTGAPTQVQKEYEGDRYAQQARFSGFAPIPPMNNEPNLGGYAKREARPTRKIKLQWQSAAWCRPDLLNESNTNKLEKRFSNMRALFWKKR